MSSIFVRLLPSLSFFSVAFAAVLGVGGWSPGFASAQCAGRPNGIVDAVEDCDDGNEFSGDGCSECRIDEGWLCTPPVRPAPLEVDHFSGASGANWVPTHPIGAWQSGRPFGASVALRGVSAFGTHELSILGNGAVRETFGFVLGYRPGDATRGSADYLLVDWLAEAKGFIPRAAPGLELTRVQGAPSRDQLLFRSGGVRGIRLASAIRNGVWTSGVIYRFVIEYSASHLRIWVAAGDGSPNLEFDIDAATAGYPEGFPDGQIGFYNHSQPRVDYAFDNLVEASVCNQAPALRDLEVRRFRGDGDASVNVPGAFVDPDGFDPDSVIVTMPPAWGEVRVNDRGRIRWSPTLPEMLGSVRLSYEACDRHPVLPACSTGSALIVTDECETDAHCPMFRPYCRDGQCIVCASDDQCDDGNDCTEDRCIESGCSATPREPGVPCAGGVCDGTGVCGGCLDSAPGTARDEGCTSASPFCDGERGLCVACLQNRDCLRGVCADDACVPCDDSVGGRGVDRGCTSLRPLCIGEGRGLRCVPCEDDRSGGMDLGCSPDAPVCNEGAGCGLCVDSGDGIDEGCQVTAPHCLGSGASARCVACVEAMDCPGGGRCLGGVCAAECRDGSDCVDAARPFCDGSGVCVECRSAAECSGGRRCLAGECQECGDDSDCSEGVCAAGACVQCAENRDCPGALVCRGLRCEPECESDAHCTGASSVCSRGSCVECETLADCEEGDRCIAGECVGTCAEDGDCPRGSPRCDVSSGQCVPCLGDGDCPDGMCEAGQCRGRCAGDDECDAGAPLCVEGLCAACSRDDHCPGERCFEGVCAECTESADCSSGEFCAAGSCVGCRGDMDCPGGHCDLRLQRCQAPCESDEQCSMPTAHCADQRCVECGEDDHCTGGETCDGGRCFALCQGPDDCAAGQGCIEGRCVGCLDDDYCHGSARGQRCLPERRECGCSDDSDCAWGHCDEDLRACVGAAPRQYGAGGCSVSGVGITASPGLGPAAPGSTVLRRTGPSSTARSSVVLSSTLLGLVVVLRRRRRRRG